MLLKASSLLAVAGLVLLAVLVWVLLPTSQRYHPALASGGGNSITAPDVAGDVGSYTSLALDNSGNPVVAYFAWTNSNLKILRCGDPTCTSGNTITSPDSVGVVGEHPSLALDAFGRPVVSYYDGTNGNLKVLHCGDSTCSSGNSITSPGTTGTVGEYSSLALDTVGHPVVSYYDRTNGNLQVLRCGDPNCGSGNSVVAPDTDGDVGLYSSLSLDDSDFPIVAYHAGTIGNPTGSLKVLHCGDATCSSGNSIASPDTLDDAGHWPSLAVSTGGNPVISYFANATEDLRLLRCGDPDCTAGNSITSPDTVGIVGLFTSLGLDSSDHPVVSYFDFDSPPNFDLKVLHCGDAMCATGNVLTSPDTTGDVGRSTSLSLDALGRPVVSYYDLTNGDLKVLRCGDPTCVGKEPPTPDLARKVIILQGIDSDAECTDGDGFDQRRDAIKDSVVSMQEEFSTTLFSEDDFLEFSYGNATACGSDYQQAKYERSDTCIGLAQAAEKLDAMVMDLPSGTVVDVIGHSMGGLVASYWAATKSRDFLDRRVHSIVTLDSPLKGAEGRRNIQRLLTRLNAVGESACEDDSASWRDINEETGAIRSFNDPNTARSTEVEAFVGINCTPIGDTLPGSWKTYRRRAVNLERGHARWCLLEDREALSLVAEALFTTLIDDQGSPSVQALEPSPSYISAWLTEFAEDPIKRRVTLTRTVGRGIEAEFSGGEITLLYRGLSLRRFAPNIKVTIDDEVVLDSLDTHCRAGCAELLKTGLGVGIHRIRLEVVEGSSRYDFRFDGFEVLPVRD